MELLEISQELGSEGGDTVRLSQFDDVDVTEFGTFDASDVDAAYCDSAEEEYEGIDKHDVLNTPDFGRLIPVSASAEKAFEELAILKLGDPNWQPHASQFMHVQKNKRSGKLRGYYRFNLSVLPRQFSLGFVGGSGTVDMQHVLRNDAEVDLLLTMDAIRDDVRGKHLRFYYHQMTWVLMVKPGPNKFIIVNGEKIRNESRVLPSIHVGITIGNLTYRFEFMTDKDSHYKSKLEELMRETIHFSRLEAPPTLDVTPLPNHFVLGNFIFQKPLAAGTYGVVSGVLDIRDGSSAAAKRLSRTKLTFESIRHEINMFKRIGDHPNVCSLVDKKFLGGDESSMVGTVHNDVILFLKPFAPFTLSQLIQRQDLKDLTVSVLHQIVQGLEHIHARGVIHRDLKPSNILLTSISPRAAVVITDFGHATDQKRDRDHMKGTVRYLAPEIVAIKKKEKEKEENKNKNKNTKTGKDDENKIGEGDKNEKTLFWSDKSDIFSFGLLASELVFRLRLKGNSYTEEDDVQEISKYMKMKAGLLYTLVMPALSWDMDSRPSAKEMNEGPWWSLRPPDAPELKRKLSTHR